MQAFCEAAEGIRTLDLLHGKQNMQGRFLENMPANRRLLATEAGEGFLAFTGKSLEFGYRTGTRADVVNSDGRAARTRLVVA
jgi:hypothetical protein